MHAPTSTSIYKFDSALYIQSNVIQLTFTTQGESQPNSCYDHNHHFPSLRCGDTGRARIFYARAALSGKRLGS